MTLPDEGRAAGQVAIVTGAARGIGRASAHALAVAGAAVTLTDVDESRGQETTAAVVADGGAARFAAHDVADPRSWQAVIADCQQAFGAPTVLVTCAYRSAYRSLLEETLDGFDAEMRVNLRGVFVGLQAIVPVMQRAGGGSIILIGSNLGLRGSEASAAYQAAKGATRMLAKNVAATFAADGIRANCIHPGAVRTEGVIEAGLQEFQDAFATRSLVGRPAAPEEIAPLVVYLASDESSYATGADFVIDGGLTAI